MAATIVVDGLNGLATQFQADWTGFFDLVLYKTNVTILITTVWADLVEADFDGYSRISVTLASPTYLGGVETIVASVATFTRGSGSPSNTIYGYALVDPAGPTLYIAEPLLTPKPMTTAGDFVQVAGKWTQQQT